MCTCCSPKAQTFPHHKEGVRLDMGQEPLMTHHTTKPAMPPMQLRIPPFSSHNRERTVMQNLWDQASHPSPPKHAGSQCIGDLSCSTSLALAGLAGDSGNILAVDTAATGLEMDLGKASQRVRTSRVASHPLDGLQGSVRVSVSAEQHLPLLQK